ncbi:NUDIX domain-containing protein [Luteococcus sp. Sow4_B9]|uniref:NUDIX domain-containing protein n=1 Tax=Luteococcus sp. Sow4_B9 TaxID=3438792 RepID=UPI003F9E7768
MTMPLDRPEFWPIAGHRLLGSGRVCTFVEDDILPPSGPRFTRQYLTHPGAVAVMALDDENRIAVVHQYRHPVAMKLVEPPAGLLDADGESYLAAAQRELAEEALLQAEDWRVLVDLFTTPGGCEESIRIYLARCLSPAPRPADFVVEDEEAHMEIHWVALDDLVEQVLAGTVQSPTMVSGTLALQTAILSGRIDALRPADAPWPARDQWALRRDERAAMES